MCAQYCFFRKKKNYSNKSSCYLMAVIFLPLKIPEHINMYYITYMLICLFILSVNALKSLIFISISILGMQDIGPGLISKPFMMSPILVAWSHLFKSDSTDHRQNTQFQQKCENIFAHLTVHRQYIIPHGKAKIFHKEHKYKINK